MKNNSFFANLHPNGGHNLPTDLQFAQAVVFTMLSKFNSLVDISFHRSSHICASGSLALQEAFNSISKSAGSLSVWLARPNFNLLYKASLDILGPNSSRSQFASFRQNLAGLHFVFGSDNEHAIKAFLTKLTSSTMGFLRKEVERHHGLPVLSLAAALVPSFDNKSSRALANSLTIASTGEQINGQSLSEDYYNVCATLASPNIGWKGDAIEPKTGIKFPTFLMENFSLTTKVLVGIGSRSMRILSLKSLKPYAFGLYVHPGSICDKLGSKYASVPVEELKNRSDFLEDLLREDLHMTVRLVVNCNGIKINNVKDAFEKSLRTRLQKMNPSTDFHCVMVFGSHFTQDIALPVGTTIDFRQTADGQLITEIAGRQVGAVHSKDLCRAFFDMYIGDLPVSIQAKEEIAENVAGLIRRC